MIILKIIGLTVEFFMLLYVIIDLILIGRKARYQKLWNLKKAALLRVDPVISRAQLCEQYVIFCMRNDCKVEF